MTPLFLLLVRDRRTGKTSIVRREGPGPCPPLVNPPGAGEVKDRKGSPALTVPPKDPEAKPKPS
jgi:hypothetical protein